MSPGQRLSSCVNGERQREEGGPSRNALRRKWIGIEGPRIEQGRIKKKNLSEGEREPSGDYRVVRIPGRRTILEPGS